MSLVSDAAPPPLSVAPPSGWKTGLPILTGRSLTLRELAVEDAASLHTHLTPREVSRFISPPPTTVEGFERFIAWALAERTAGRYVCFAVVPHDDGSAVGLFQVRQLEPSLGTAEWGFALGQHYWGRGLFAAAARLVLEFTMTVLGVHRLEARSSVLNGRGNSALRKIGATAEGVLRQSFFKDGVYYDQLLWTITAEDWRVRHGPAGRLH
jgi:RimJ/RimL family protein N-acetyltransferase